MTSSRTALSNFSCCKTRKSPLLQGNGLFCWALFRWLCQSACTGLAAVGLRLRCIAVSAAAECRQKKSGQCPLKILFLSPIVNGFHHELYSTSCPCQSGQRLVKKCTALPASAAAVTAGPGSDPARRIGRASCRERV